MISYFFQDIEKLEIPSKIALWLEHLILAENKKIGEITYVFSNDDYILKINKDYLQHDYYTDIITFDYVKGKTISGDIFVSLPRISDNAKIFNKTFDEEFRRVLAHGVLHLCGYGDKSEDQQELMSAKEDFYLKLYQDLP